MSFLFEWWNHDFMKYALLAIVLIMPVFSLVGTQIVNGGMSFFSDALGHSVLTGVGIGVILGVTSSLIQQIVVLIFLVLFSLGMNKIRHSEIASADTIIGVFSSCGIALGLVILSKNGGFSKFQSLLIGDILSIGRTEIIQIAVLLVVTVFVWLISYNSLLSITINPAISRSKDIKTVFVDNVFVVLVAIVVALSIRWVGLLIINAMLVLPAASARNISKNIRMYHIISMIFSLFSGLCGLIISYYYAVATGPMIVLISGIIFFGTFFIRKSNAYVDSVV